jgi:UDP-N-acetylglucosamine acyltransferase
MIVEGNPTRVRGLNVVGLRRLGIGPAARAELRRAFRLLYRSGLNTSQALERMRQEGLTGSEVQRLITFIEQSKRGICGGASASEGGELAEGGADEDG